MPQSKLSFFRRLGQTANYRTAVSLHSHTNHSRETLQFIPKFAAKYPVLRWALERQCKKSKIPVDFRRVYWTPPLTARMAYEVESHQIENVVRLASLVSLTDHDSIAAPSLLRALPETRDIPLALEWTVPYRGAEFHLGVHNLPDTRAVEITAGLAAYTKYPGASSLRELLANLDQFPEVLVVFNHPLWDLRQLGPGYLQLVKEFLEHYGSFIHALEINGARGWGENTQVIEWAKRFNRPIVSGGDRHGREPSGALNLTRAESFPEFIAEVRYKQCSHVLMMPQYAEPRCVHVTRELLDAIREYPEYPVGSRRWDDRVFHPSPTMAENCAISTLWKAPPAFIEVIFSALSLLENTLVQRAMKRAMKDEAHAQVAQIGREATS
jgi:hypothetical protein